MRIQSMTATFGKLENQTLTFQPGLNIIEAPNEWGKSTWCAFLAAMLYGLDTRAKSTKTALADKERYQPWSGAPMAGRLEISWQGRDITIERRTKGRIPLGEFRAYETVSGLTVKELTAANCGQILLGVEKSVFLRSAFIRQNDIRITGDENLSRRLQNLVTTGDEGEAGEHLAKQLKELKNRCRYHRTGLLPQAEGERTALEEQLSQLNRMETAIRDLEIRQRENRGWMTRLERHGAYLAYRSALNDAHQVRRAEQQWREAEARLRELCETEPEKKSGKPLLPGLLVILLGILLGWLWDVTAGVLMVLLGVGLCFLSVRNSGSKTGKSDEEDYLAEAQKAAGCRAQYETLRAMAKPLPTKTEPVGLDLDEGQTAEKLREARAEEARLESRRSQIAGRMEAFGDRKTLENQVKTLNLRIEKLEKTYAALTMAQETLAEASAQLQRRFAPRIAEGAAKRMSRLTNGRYDRLRLKEDLGLLAGAEGEETLREANWRSDGTVDQLYLSLRLSVAEVLIPASPLILDDAFVRFDDERLKAALALLQEESESRQVILFTCQSREKNLL